MKYLDMPTSHAHHSMATQCALIQMSILLKGQCHEIFYLCFLSIEPISAPESHAKVLSKNIIFCFRKVMNTFQKLHGVQDTTESDSPALDTP